MITLTNPIQVPTVLGSATKTSYDKLVMSMINYDVPAKVITGQCLLTATGNPAAMPIQGTFNIPSAGTLTISIPSLSFYASAILSAPQTAAVQGWITAGQNSIEAGLLAIGLASGVQANG